MKLAVEAYGDCLKRLEKVRQLEDRANVLAENHRDIIIAFDELKESAFSVVLRGMNKNTLIANPRLLLHQANIPKEITNDPLKASVLSLITEMEREKEILASLKTCEQVESGFPELY
jgi:hypothetical protein